MHKEDLIDLLISIGFGICWVLMTIAVAISLGSLFK